MHVRVTVRVKVRAWVRVRARVFGAEVEGLNVREGELHG